MMRSTIFLILLFPLALLCRDWHSVNDYFPVTVDKGLSAMLNGDYRQADSIWNSLSHQHKLSPFPVYFKLLTLQGKMVDYESYSEMAHFEALRDSLIAVCRGEIKKEHPALVYYFLGAASFYRANLLTRTGKNWEAFSESRTGSRWLEKSVRLDSTLAEPQILLFAYKYWKSRKAGFLRKLFLIKDEREQGIIGLQQIEIANRAVQAIRNDQLAWIYIDIGQPSAALKLIQWNLEQYPRSRFFRWTQLAIELALKDIHRAVDILFMLHYSYSGIVWTAPQNYLITLQKILKNIPNSYRKDDRKKVITQYMLRQKKLRAKKDLKKYMDAINRELKSGREKRVEPRK